jgi:hypothetical protein
LWPRGETAFSPCRRFPRRRRQHYTVPLVNHQIVSRLYRFRLHVALCGPRRVPCPPGYDHWAERVRGGAGRGSPDSGGRGRHLGPLRGFWRASRAHGGLAPAPGAEDTRRPLQGGCGVPLARTRRSGCRARTVRAGRELCRNGSGLTPPARRGEITRARRADRGRTDPRRDGPRTGPTPGPAVTVAGRPGVAQRRGHTAPGTRGPRVRPWRTNRSA